MFRRLIPLVVVCATLVGLIVFAGTMLSGSSTSAGPPAPFRCPGAQFSFPVNGSLGWIYREPASIESSGTVHAGLDVWASGGDGSPVYAMADGVVSRTQNSWSFDIIYEDSGVESYMTHTRHSLSVNDVVTAGQVIAETDGEWIHFSVGEVGYDDRVIPQTRDPSPFLAANVNYDDGARNPLPYGRPLSIWCSDAEEDDIPTGESLCDGVIDSIDALVVLQYSAGLIGSKPCADRADVNGDGLIDSLDAVLILQYAAGLLPKLPF